MAITDKPMTWKEFQAIKSQLVTELQLTPREWLSMLAQNIDSAGTPQQLLSTSGYVTESNAQTYLGAMNTYLQVANRQNGPPSFSNASPGAIQQVRRLAVTLTATAGGEIVAAPLVAALASYKSCMVITHLWSDQTDGSISMTISTTSGLSNGPGTWIWGTTANTVTDYGLGVAYKGSTANEAINAACAAGQAQANQVIQVLGYYWYEA